MDPLLITGCESVDIARNKGRDGYYYYYYHHNHYHNHIMIIIINIFLFLFFFFLILILIFILILIWLIAWLDTLLDYCMAGYMVDWEIGCGFGLPHIYLYQYYYHHHNHYNHLWSNSIISNSIISNSINSNSIIITICEWWRLSSHVPFQPPSFGKIQLVDRFV